MSAPTWPADVGRSILAAGVPWLPGDLVLVLKDGIVVDRYRCDWIEDGAPCRYVEFHGGAVGDEAVKDASDDATRGAARGWLMDRRDGAVACWFRGHRWGLLAPSNGGDDWREAEARALLALAMEVLSLPCGHPVSSVVASGSGPEVTNHCGACAQEGSES